MGCLEWWCGGGATDSGHRSPFVIDAVIINIMSVKYVTPFSLENAKVESKRQKSQKKLPAVRCKQVKMLSV